MTFRRAHERDRGGIFTVLRTANFHDVPSPEMPELELADMFVAEQKGEIVGVAGYRVLAPGEGKTTLMAVLPECRGQGVGERLHALRLDAMRRLGCRRVTTNADRPDTIAWYKRKFGYREVGRLAKLHEFGLPEVDHWTTLEMDLESWPRERGKG